MVLDRYHCKPKVIGDPVMALISFDDFLNVEIRVGTVVPLRTLSRGPPPGDQALGRFWWRNRRAQIQRANYPTLSAPKTWSGGRSSLWSISPTKQIGPFMSEFLTLGLHDDDDNVVLVSPRQASSQRRTFGLTDAFAQRRDQSPSGSKSMTTPVHAIAQDRWAQVRLERRDLGVTCSGNNGSPRAS